MWSLLSVFTLAQATPAPAPSPQEVFRPQEVRPLTGQLDSVLVFNSNSPELIQNEGILLSTFPPEDKSTPAAHLNIPFNGKFEIFAHHIAKPPAPEDLRTLYLGMLVHNPGSQPVTVDVLQAASYLSQPDAPFMDLPPVVDNPIGAVFAGPGSRAMDAVLRGLRQDQFPPQLVIPPGESRMVLNLPIPVKTLTPPLNGRSTLMRLRSNAPVYLASLAMYAKPTAEGDERAPSVEEWQTLLETGGFAGPRDRTPTPPDQQKGAIIYGRVAGVAQGAEWRSQLVDNPDNWSAEGWYLTIPQRGQAMSYALSTLTGGRLGTGQDQTTPLIARYPDTAYRTHGNYAIQYSLTLPLRNTTEQPQTVTLAIQTPIKQDQIKDGLRFFEPPQRQVFFRGTVRLRYNDDRNLPQTRYVHLVQRRGQQGEPLITLNLPPGDRRLVQVEFLYPPDATPPQVLTLTTLEQPSN